MLCPRWIRLTPSLTPPKLRDKDNKPCDFYMRVCHFGCSNPPLFFTITSIGYRSTTFRSKNTCRCWKVSDRRLLPTRVHPEGRTEQGRGDRRGPRSLSPSLGLLTRSNLDLAGT